jgi:catechol 2,3-dioxygenase-like lactoylglutathione lyase family enzyme
MIVAIDHVQLAMPPGQEALARKFYGTVLGLPEVPKPPDRARRGGAWFENEHVKIHLGVEADFRPARKAHPGLVVSDLAAVLERVRGAGGSVEASDDGDDHAYVSDPFGNRLELIQAQ